MSSIVSTAGEPMSELPDDEIQNLTIPPGMSENEFVAWVTALPAGHVEWVDGEVITLAPMSTRHARIFNWLHTLLSMYVSERRLGEVFGTEYTVRLSVQDRISRRMPDLMFIRADRLHLVRKNHFDGAPDLAIEIVSPESQQRDWIDKRNEYAAAGVEEYWIIDPLTERFEAFQRGTEGKHVSLGQNSAGPFQSPVVPGFQVQIEWLWNAAPPSVLTVLRGLGLIS